MFGNPQFPSFYYYISVESPLGSKKAGKSGGDRGGGGFPRKNGGGQAFLFGAIPPPPQSSSVRIPVIEAGGYQAKEEEEGQPGSTEKKEEEKLSRRERERRKQSRPLDNQRTENRQFIQTNSNSAQNYRTLVRYYLWIVALYYVLIIREFGKNRTGRQRTSKKEGRGGGGRGGLVVPLSCLLTLRPTNLASLEDEYQIWPSSLFHQERKKNFQTWPLFPLKRPSDYQNLLFTVLSSCRWIKWGRQWLLFNSPFFSGESLIPHTKKALPRLSGHKVSIKWTGLGIHHTRKVY